MEKRLSFPPGTRRTGRMAVVCSRTLYLALRFSLIQCFSGAIRTYRRMLALTLEYCLDIDRG